MSRLTIAGIKTSSRSGSLANISWTTLTASFSSFHSRAPQRLMPPGAAFPPADGIRFARLWLAITANPTTMQFSFRRGRIMSPNTLSSLLTAREMSAARLWTMLLRILLLPWILLVHDIISRGLGPWAGWGGTFASGPLIIKRNSVRAFVFEQICWRK